MINKLNLFSLIISIVFLIYAIYIFFYSDDMIVKGLSVSLIIYYCLAIPTQIKILTLNCICKS